MSSTNKTTNLELSQFIGSDSPKWLTDYNADMEKIDAGYQTVKAQADATDLVVSGHTSSITSLQDTTTSQGTAITQLRTDVNGNSGSINTITSLIGNGEPTTTDKTLIGAINEMDVNVSKLSNRYIISNPSQSYTHEGASDATFGSAIVAALSEFKTNVIANLANAERARVIAVKIGNFIYRVHSETFLAHTATTITVDSVRIALDGTNGLDIREFIASNTALTRFNEMKIATDNTITFSDLSGVAFTGNIEIIYETYYHLS